MNFLHVIRSVNPQGGGPIEGIKQLARLTDRKEHRVEILSLDDPEAHWVKECPVPVHAVGPATGNYGYTARLRPWLRQHHAEYQGVIVNGLWQYGSFGTWRALHQTETPYFVFPHGMLDPWFKRAYPLKHLKKWLYWPWTDYRVLRDARAVLFTCEEERRLARQSFWLYRCRELVVNFGTSPPEGDPQKQQAAFLEKFPGLRDKQILLYLGRIHEKKGMDLLIQAFGQAPQHSVQSGAKAILLAIAGPCALPAYEARLRQLAKEVCPPNSVHWLGFLYDEAKWGALRAADAFILPSHQENFGIAIVEALACGLPVLISNKVNIWREIQDDGAGFVAEDDLPGVRGLLSKWLSLPEDQRQAMRGQAKSCFARRFNMEDTARQLIQIIKASP